MTWGIIVSYVYAKEGRTDSPVMSKSQREVGETNQKVEETNEEEETS